MLLTKDTFFVKVGEGEEGVKEDMIVRCASCARRYYVDDEVIGAKGRLVRCTSCSHVWHQDPVDPGKGALLVLPPSSSSEDARVVHTSGTERHPLLVWGGALLLALFCFGIISVLGAGEISKFFPQSRIYYEMLGVLKPRAQDALEIHNLAVRRDETSSAVIITGEIVNVSPHVFPLPVLSLGFMRKDPLRPEGEVEVKRLKHSLGKKPLLPKERMSFEITIQDPIPDFSFIAASVEP